MNKIFVFACVIVSTATGFGQDLAKNLHLTPPAQASWSISYKDKEHGKHSAGRNSNEMAEVSEAQLKDKEVSEEVYEINNRIARVTRHYTDGSQAQNYVVDNLALIQDPQSKKVRIEAVDEFTGAGFHFRICFPGFEWVKPEFYVDSVAQGDVQLYHFRLDQQPLAGDKSFPELTHHPGSSDREAWVDAKTGLPYAFRNGTIYGVYHYGSGQSLDIKLPAEFEKARRRYYGYP
jgi:hypothetical protein